jgi:hypothetical protein
MTEAGMSPCCDLTEGEPGKALLSVRVPQWLADRLAESAREHGVSLSFVLRAALNEFEQFHMTDAEMDRIKGTAMEATLTAPPTPYLTLGCQHMSISGRFTSSSAKGMCGCELRPFTPNTYAA